jgi:hypothetical protein
MGERGNSSIIFPGNSLNLKRDSQERGLLRDEEGDRREGRLRRGEE